VANGKKINTNTDGTKGCDSKGDISTNLNHLGVAINFLEKVDELGSMSEAAKAVGISYTSGLKMVDKLNDLTKRTMIMTHPGGTNGGETRLTLEGKVFLKWYWKMKLMF
jgi:molybdate transport repressor ModE-like protein